MEGVEVMEVHMNRSFTQLVVWQSTRLQEDRNLTVINGINRKAVIWTETGEVYNGGFLIINAVDLYWRGK